MPNSPGYVWEKMYVAIDCMCGKVSLEKRLANAAVSALCRLEVDDLEESDLREDLKFVLSWTKDNLDGGDGVKKVPDDLEHARLVEKMLHILLETHQQ
jgi:hypothetical protein